MAKDARGRLIGAAVSLMRENGVAGTGLSDVIRRSGTARRSIYLNFPGGKSELVAEATRTVGDSLTVVLDSIAAQPEPVAAFARIWEGFLLESDFVAGCPIAAAALGGKEAPEAVAAAGKVFTAWADRLSEWLLEQGVRPDRATGLATTIVATIEGSVLLSQAQRSADPLRQAALYMQQLIESNMPPA